MPYDDICFVIMPFGKKAVSDDQGKSRTIDFDPIYYDIFEPAIRAVSLPEGGRLSPRRTDQDFFAASIPQDMFEYLEYSRIALADITGLNANVLYELGVRHRAQESGTVILRQPGALIPFDIAQIKAFPYEYEPLEQAEASRAFITKVVTESLTHNRLDSPVKIALRAQRNEHRDIEANLKRAEDAIRREDWTSAMNEYRAALRQDPANNYLRLRLGLLLKDRAEWQEALQQFDAAIAGDDRYGEAYREKGIVQNKLFHKAKAPSGMPDGIDALEAAIERNPADYDALASLGGALRRAKRLDKSLDNYRRATEASQGNSYPLLNQIKLAAMLSGTLEITPREKFLLSRAERSLRAQMKSDPPFNAPWCFFDLAEMQLYKGDRAGFLDLATQGCEVSIADWQILAFRDALQDLASAGITLDGLMEGISELTQRASFLAKPGGV